MATMSKEAIFNVETGETELIDVVDTPIEPSVVQPPTLEERVASNEELLMALLNGEITL
jgi:hypothetical protein